MKDLYTYKSAYLRKYEIKNVITDAIEKGENGAPICEQFF